MRFVTSLSPHRTDRQKYCLSTWRKIGLPITAVQMASEVESMQEVYPEVDTWVPVERGGEELGRPNCPRIFDMIQQAKDEPVILINSDISTKDDPRDFMRTWDSGSERKDVLAVCARKDYRRAGEKKVLNPYGIDTFRILPEMVGVFPDRNWCIGYPGWDYSLLIEAYQAGYEVKRVDSLMLHEVHEGGYAGSDIEIASRKLSRDHRIPLQAVTDFVQALTGRYRIRRKRQ